MNRRLGLAVLVIAMMVAACGRQVTGLNTPGGGSIPQGQMLIRLNVVGTLDFVNFTYVIVFNTSGTGGEPYSQALATGLLNYSYSFAFGGGSSGQEIFTQYFANPGTTASINHRNLTIAPELFQFQPNFSGLTSQFQVQFFRSLLDQPNPTATVAPTATGSPVPNPTTTAQQSWYINFFVTDSTGNVVDSMGPNGSTDTTYNLLINTTQSQNINYTKPTGGTVPADGPNAQLAGFTLLNTP